MDGQHDSNSQGESHQNADSREITWNHAIEELLCEEAEKCSGLSWLHNKSETKFAARTNFMQIPIIVLSAVSGFISAALPPNEPGASIGIGAVSILVSILGTINSYFAFAKRTEGHRIASVQYAQICRTIRIEMNLPQEQRTPPKVLLKMIKEDLKRLSETAPRISKAAMEAFRTEIMPKAENISHPEIIDGIENVKPYQEHTAKPEIVIDSHHVTVEANAVNVIEENIPGEVKKIDLDA